MRRTACVLLLILCGLVSPLRGESEAELQAAREVQALLQSDKLADAEQELDAKLKEFPASPRVNSLRMNFAYAYRRSNQHADALRHMQKLVDYYLSASATESGLYTQLANSLTAMGSYARVAEKVDQAREQFQRTLTQLEQRKAANAEAEHTEATNGALHAVRLRMIDFLIAIADYEEAQTHLDAELVQAKREYDARSDSTEYILHLSNALRARVVLREERGDEGLKDARDRQLAFLQSKAEQHSDNPSIVAAYLDAHIASVTSLSRSNPDEAEKILAAAKAFVNTLDTSNRELSQRATIALRTFPYLEQTIATGKQHARLINSPAEPLGDVTWVVGNTLDKSALDGKVLLLDFWAVWCGPCLDSFPDLNRWHTKYADKGLRVVGVTRFYDYRWDEANRKAVKLDENDKVPRDEELAMLAKFAETHKLGYPLAVTPPGSDFARKFGVMGIPQTVLIDRAGRIRLIRVGTGPTIVREIEREIEKLLKE